MSDWLTTMLINEQMCVWQLSERWKRQKELVERGMHYSSSSSPDEAMEGWSGMEVGMLWHRTDGWLRGLLRYYLKVSLHPRRKSAGKAADGFSRGWETWRLELLLIWRRHSVKPELCLSHNVGTLNVYGPWCSFKKKMIIHASLWRPTPLNSGCFKSLIPLSLDLRWEVRILLYM